MRPVAEPMAEILSIIVKGYPRLSETFIAQELLGLQDRGIEFEIVSLRHPTDKKRHLVHDQILAPVRYLPEYLYLEPRRVLTAWWRLRRQPRYKMARKQWLRDLKRDFTANRIRRFGQALVLADEMSGRTSWIYAHFLHTPASVAQYAALLRGLPWSCSAHAKDIWTSPSWEKIGKLQQMQWLVTCTGYNVEHLQGLNSATAGKISLLYHGLDLTRFRSPQETYSDSDGSREKPPVVILSVGRAVEKKGYGVLLRALKEMPAELNWTFIHIGGGPRLGDLQKLAQRLGLGERITWLGACSQPEILSRYRQADIFALTSLVASDGDRDGLPNVLMEAQSQGLVCLSTKVSAIPELIDDRQTGLLVPPDDVIQTASALQDLITDPLLRARLGRAGQERIRTQFSHESGIDELARRFSGVRENDRQLHEAPECDCAEPRPAPFQQ